MKISVSDTPGFTVVSFHMYHHCYFECYHHIRYNHHHSIPNASLLLPQSLRFSATPEWPACIPKGHPGHREIQVARTALKNSSTEDSKEAESGTKFTFGDSDGYLLSSTAETK